ncbi:hypothetical protein V6N13_052772 [Hibiscus sabdariffa]|uniref:Uncharacterized protein n=1 Tax=Hibiscus sabdariffa TaxID=183260 RepID=A0ABR2Q5C0_9ROSI
MTSRVKKLNHYSRDDALIGSIFMVKTAGDIDARNMPVAKENQQELHDDQVLTATEDHVKVDELVSMDYSPATRKPPIHN